ncbi:hypothetical protein HK101_011536 [Irineochytrium annulatum]|nr:hypothetical protein HK101_011536 [Irineochytrium annulatum]
MELRLLQSIFANDPYLQEQEMGELYQQEAATHISKIRQLTVDDAANQLDIGHYLDGADQSAEQITKDLTLPTSVVLYNVLLAAVFPVTILKQFDDQQKIDLDAEQLEIYNADNVKGNLRLVTTGEYEGGEEISFATAEDPLFWKALNNGKSILQSNMGEKGLRDPFVIRSAEGDKFYMLATDLKMGESTNFDQAQMTGSHYMMVWESEDLVNWSEQRMIKVAPKTGGNTWAPEAIYDPVTGDYIVFWASSMKNTETYGDYNGRPEGQYNVMYYATTRDFYTFSEPKVMIDESLPTIDTTFIEQNNMLYRFTKSEVNTKVYVEKAPTFYYDKDGIAANGLQYDAVPGYVKLPDHLIQSLNLEKATFSTWVQMDKNQANQRIFDFASETGRQSCHKEFSMD